MRSRPALIKLGNEVRDRREARGLTQEKFAEAAGIGVGTLKNLERAKSDCRIGTLFEVARGLCMPLSDLIARVERRA